MATGIRPFLGETAAALFDEILHKAPETGSHLDASMPAGLGRVIDKALEKDVSARYQSAVDLLADLRSLAVRPGRLRRPSRGSPWILSGSDRSRFSRSPT